MALSRIRISERLPTVLSRFSRSANGTSTDEHNRSTGAERSWKPSSKAGFHLSGIRRYPEAPKLALPSNVSEIFSNETGRFTPERARDIAAPVLYYTATRGNVDVLSFSSWASVRGSRSDEHVDSYDCFGAVSLNSSMQSNVPQPYCSSGKASHFNMPGGQFAESSKYIAADMQNSHYTIIKENQTGNKRFNGPLYWADLTRQTQNVSRARFSTDSKSMADEKSKNSATPDDTNVVTPVPTTRIEKLRKAIKDYGKTVLVFHIGISLISLGTCYVALSSGIDLGSFIKTTPFGSSERLEKALATSSTFLVAYAIHKLLAPVRISITLGATPFIVRYLRRIGVLQRPKA